MGMSRNYVSTGTFSILAISPDSRLMGVVVASGSTYVGDRVPYAKPGIGVIVTQAYTNTIYGTKGLELLIKGLTPQKVMNTLLEEDPEREQRQVAIMDFKRRKAIFTGINAPEYHAEIAGEEYIIIGNMLSRKEVVNSMAKKFEDSSGDLSLRMIKALEAGSKSDGDRRGERSAALIVVDTEKVKVEIKVDAHKDPIQELFRKLNA